MIPVSAALSSLLEQYRQRAAMYRDDGQEAPAAMCARFVEHLERALGPSAAVVPPQSPLAVVPAASWRERLWTCPAETRLGVAELSDALGRAKSWVYRHTSARSGLVLLPHRKLDGELLFVAGEIRRWLAEHEEVVKPGAAAPTSVVRPIRSARATPTRRAS